MRLGQIRSHSEYVAAVFEAGTARPIPGYNLRDLINRSENEKSPLPTLAAKLASHHPEYHGMDIPIHPHEVWACGCTYEISAAFRDSEHGEESGIYNYVYSRPRPEIFMKGTSRVCVGPGHAIGMRADSHFTAPEPELGLVLGSHGAILGYTLANDVSAWDIERENPLYLPQSKVYAASCALGPVIVTTDQIPDPYQLDMSCTVTRNGSERFSGSVSLARLRRRFEELVEYLLRSNPVPSGSVLLTGTGIIVPQEAALEPGDVVSIRVPEIGELINPVVRV
jgi:2-dehydro-3-deoxy-D-arabinonate dehydratase